MKKTNFLIIGSGIAGLCTALKLTKIGEVTILTKKKTEQGSTTLAQGGIAGVRKNALDDNPEIHYKDTLKAGGFLNDQKNTKYLVENANKALEKLEEYGLKFDKTLHREGGHTYHRVAHVTDETGRAIEEILIQKIQKNKNIQVLENHLAIDLIQKNNIIYGITCFNEKNIKYIYAQKTILATGGTGQIYAKTTNPEVATGDGIAMGLRAGAKTKDLEFVQFHPTAFDYPREPIFLLSESLRGAGALLKNEKNERFIDELKPRDIVARAIFKQKKTFIDFTHKDEKYLSQHFPNIFQNLKQENYNLAKDLIPITPVAHFLCGGIKTDLRGRTNLQNLYAIGETACTGVHGANRLASNSLLEGVVFADSIYQDIKKNYLNQKLIYPKNIILNSEFIPENKKDQEIRQKIKKLMWENVGLVRKISHLEKTLEEFNNLKPKSTEVNNIFLVAREICQAAFLRKESIGCHYIEEEQLY